MTDNAFNFSYSKIATYLQCPKMYELQFIKKVVEFKENIYTAFGSAIHKAIEMSIKKNLDFEESMVIFECELKNKINQMDPRESQLIFINEWVKKGKEILLFYFEKYYEKIKNKEIEVIDAEKYFSFEIKPGIFYNGIIDLLCKCNEEITEKKQIPIIKTNNAGIQKKTFKTIIEKSNKIVYKILDWKTGSVKKDTLQLSSYTVPTFLNEGILISEIDYVYLKHKREIKENIDIDKINATKSKLISIINNIMADTKGKNFNMCLDKKICKYCNVKKQCDKEFDSDLESL